jgi:hypothetical protein
MVDVPVATTNSDMVGNTTNIEGLITMVIEEAPTPAPTGNEVPPLQPHRNPQPWAQDIPAAPPQALPAVVERLEIGDHNPHVFVFIFHNDQHADLHGEALTQPAAAHQTVLHCISGSDNPTPTRSLSLATRKTPSMHT